MKKLNVTVYTTKEDIEEYLDMEGVYKCIEIDDTLIIFYDTDDIEVWNKNDSKIVKFVHDMYDKPDDDEIEYRYLEEFFLENYM